MFFFKSMMLLNHQHNDCEATCCTPRRHDVTLLTQSVFKESVLHR